MESYQRFAIRVLARLTGVSVNSLNKWVDIGLIRPRREATVSGDKHLFGIGNALAVALSNEARKRGVPMPQTRIIAKLLSGRPIESMLADFDEGKSLLVVVGDAALDRFVTPAELRQPAGIANLAASIVAGKQVIAVDVRAAYQRIAAAIDAAVTKAEAEATP